MNRESITHENQSTVHMNQRLKRRYGLSQDLYRPARL